jgi:hypothetical protein
MDAKTRRLFAAALILLAIAIGFFGWATVAYVHAQDVAASPAHTTACQTVTIKTATQTTWYPVCG